MLSEHMYTASTNCLTLRNVDVLHDRWTNSRDIIQTLSRKLLFTSNYPAEQLHQAKTEFDGLHIATSEQRSQVFANNAQELLGG